MKTAVKRFETICPKGTIYILEKHQPYKIIHTLDGPQTHEALPHYEWNGIKINPPKNGVFDLFTINTKVKLIEQ